MQSQHIDEPFRPIYTDHDMNAYLSDAGHGRTQVEDFPVQNVRQNCDDYRKGKATTSRHSSVTNTEADLWRRCNELLRAEKKLSKLFITSTCIHLIVLVFVTISVSSKFITAATRL